MSDIPPTLPTTGMVRPHRGVTVLVLGILSLVFGCVVLGIISWVMGSGDLREMQAGRMDPSGMGLTKAGKILGIISVILSAVGILLTILWMVFFAAFGIAAAGSASGVGP